MGGTQQDRRAYKRSAIQVPLELSDLNGVVPGKTVDVSRGGLLAQTAVPPAVGTLLRVRVTAANDLAVMAIGVVVRCPNTDGEGVPLEGRGVAIALTSTSEAWDRFWEDINTPGHAAGEA